MLTSFNLLPKHILLLLSNQVVQICDDISEFRCKAVTTNMSNPLATASRFCWVTLQAHGCMEAYLKDRFRRHPGINSSFIRFLTRHMADQMAYACKEVGRSLGDKDHSGNVQQVGCQGGGYHHCQQSQAQEMTPSCQCIHPNCLTNNPPCGMYQ